MYNNCRVSRGECEGAIVYCDIDKAVTDQLKHTCARNGIDWTVLLKSVSDVSKDTQLNAIRTILKTKWGITRVRKAPEQCTVAQLKGILKSRNVTAGKDGNNKPGLVKAVQAMYKMENRQWKEHGILPILCTYRHDMLTNCLLAKVLFPSQAQDVDVTTLVTQRDFERKAVGVAQCAEISPPIRQSVISNFFQHKGHHDRDVRLLASTRVEKAGWAYCAAMSPCVLDTMSMYVTEDWTRARYIMQIPSACKADTTYTTMVDVELRRCEGQYSITKVSSSTCSCPAGHYRCKHSAVVLWSCLQLPGVGDTCTSKLMSWHHTALRSNPYDTSLTFSQLQRYATMDEPGLEKRTYARPRTALICTPTSRGADDIKATPIIENKSFTKLVLEFSAAGATRSQEAKSTMQRKRKRQSFPSDETKQTSAQRFKIWLLQKASALKHLFTANEPVGLSTPQAKRRRVTTRNAPWSTPRKQNTQRAHRRVRREITYMDVDEEGGEVRRPKQTTAESFNRGIFRQPHS